MFLRLFAVFFCSLCLIQPVSAQLLLGRISGTVTDVSKAAIPNAHIEATNTGTGLTVDTTAQSNGLYQFENLPIGTYKVTVTAPGLQTKIFSSIPVQANRTTTVDAELPVATASATVEVTSETPLVNQTDATVGYVLDSRTIEATPLGTGSFTQVAILSPGVNADFLNTSGTNAGLGNQNIWANGQRDTSNTFTLNAISGNNLFNGKSSSQVAENRFLLNTGQNSIQHAGGDVQTSTSVYDAIGEGMPTPAPESLQELRVNAAQYDSSQGGTSGAQIALITKSGTNSFHGELYEYFQNNLMNAAQFFRNSDTSIPQSDKVPALHYNRFGVTFGGPIIKDKLFFFTSYQGIRDHDALESTSYATVPQDLTDDRSAAALSAIAAKDFGVTIAPSAISPAALALFNYKYQGRYIIPTPTVTNPALAAQLNYNAFVSGVPTVMTQDQGNANIDWNASEKDRISAKYFISNNPSTSPFAQSSTIGFPQTLHAGSQVASIDNTYVVTPKLVWEQRVGFSRQRAFSSMDQALTPQQAGVNLFGGTLFPDIYVSQADGKLKNRFVLGPQNNFGNAGVFQNRYTWGTNATWTLDRHTITFGMSMDYVQLNIINLNSQVASIETNTFADFLRGTPLVQQYSYYFTGASNRYYHAWQTGAYINDNYRVKSNLTINLGLRYDYNGPFSEKYGRLANFFPDKYQYNAATDTVVSSGVLVAANNPALGTSGVPDSTLNGRQWGLSPRVSIAWSPGYIKNLTFRSGFGLFFDRGEFFTYLSPGAGRGFSGPFGVTLQLPFTAQVMASSTGTLANPFGSAPAAPPTNANSITALLPNLAQLRAGASPYLFGGYDPRNTLPYTETWNADMQYQFGNNWLADIGYVGNHGVHQILPIPFNQPGIATPSNPINGETYSYGFNIIPTETVRTSEGGNTDLRVPYIGFSSNSVLYQSSGVSSYNALQAGLRKQLSFGLQFTASYTYSHALDEQSALGLFFNGNNPLTPKTSYGTSSFDRTHVFIVSYLYELPKFVDQKSMLSQLTNGWQLSGLATAQSGQPFNFYDYSGAVAGQYLSNTVNISDPIIGFQPGYTYKQVQLQGTTGVNPALPYIDASKLYIPVIAPGTNGVPPCVAAANGSQLCDTYETGFANSGRNVFRGPFQTRFDLGLAKSFRISERFSLKLGAQAFNMFNHPSFDVPNNGTSLYSVSNGKVTVRGASSSAGFISHTIGSPRFIQLTAHLTF